MMTTLLVLAIWLLLPFLLAVLAGKFVRKVRGRRTTIERILDIAP
jgi:hypothetical protein